MVLDYYSLFFALIINTSLDRRSIEGETSICDGKRLSQKIDSDSGAIRENRVF